MPISEARRWARPIGSSPPALTSPIRTSPAVGVRRSARTDTRVDFPAPDRPRIAVELARGRSSGTSRRATTGPVVDGYSTVTPWREAAGAPSSAIGRRYEGGAYRQV